MINKLQWLQMIAKLQFIKIQEIEKKWGGKIIKIMGLVKLRFPPREINDD